MDFTRAYLEKVANLDNKVKVYDAINTTWINNLESLINIHDSLIVDFPDIVGVARDVHIKGAKHYTIYESADHVPINEDHHFNEMFFKNRKYRFFVDVDKDRYFVLCCVSC